MYTERQTEKPISYSPPMFTLFTLTEIKIFKNIFWQKCSWL